MGWASSWTCQRWTTFSSGAEEPGNWFPADATIAETLAEHARPGDTTDTTDTTEVLAVRCGACNSSERTDP